MSYAVLYGGKTPLPNDSENSTARTPIARNFSVCGANDCQDPNITNANLNRYEPASQALVYILIGVTAALVVVALFIQGCFVESINSEEAVYSVTLQEAENDDQESITNDKVTYCKEDCILVN